MQFAVILFDRKMCEKLCKIIRFKRINSKLDNTLKSWEKFDEVSVENPTDDISLLLSAYSTDSDIILISSLRLYVLDKENLKIKDSFPHDEINTETHVRPKMAFCCSKSEDGYILIAFKIS